MPNILLFFPDQHRGDIMAYTENDDAHMPNLDKLASEHILFSECHTNAPLCIPARGSLITCAWLNRNVMWGNNLAEADRHGDSLVRNIWDAGYHTAMFGKTHLYPNHLNDGHMRDHVHKLHHWCYQTNQ